MAVNALNANLCSLRGLKKRELVVNNEFDGYLSNNIVESEDASIDIEYIKKENDETPGEKKYDNKNSPISNCSNTGKTNSDGNDKVTNNTRSSLISVRKFEDLCKTPTRNNSVNETIHRNSIKKENTFSPLKFSPSTPPLTVSPSEWNLNAVKELQEPLTPVKKRELYIEEPSTLVERKKRKISDIGEYDQLSGSIKTELYDGTLNDMEHIEMLHDLDSVMGFQDEKISIFLTSATDDMQDEENIDASRDPPVDPLSIDKHDICDAFVKNVKKKKYETNVERIASLRHDRINTANNIKYKEISSSDDELDENPRERKIVLRELDIQSDTEDEQLSDAIKKRLYNFTVQLTHDVPPQHKVQSNLSKPLTRGKRHLFLQHASLRKGVFLPYEDEIIKNNWKKFCEVHDWNPEIIKPFLCMRNGKKCYIRSPKERQKFVQYLANGLPYRSLNSVLYRCKNLFLKYEKSSQRYCTEEDEIILSYMASDYRKQKKQRNHFSKLGRMLKRNRYSIWLRYRTLKNMQARRTNKPVLEVEWTPVLVGTFIQNLMEVTLCEKVEELKDAVIPKLIWLKLEKKLNINLKVLKEFWTLRLHMQLFCPEPIYLNDIRIKLIEYMYGKGISNNREIIWPSVARYFDGVTTAFLSKVFLCLVREAKKRIGVKCFPDIIEYLYNSKMLEIKNSRVDKLLPRLSYKDRNIQILDEDTDHYIAKKI